MSHTRYHTKIEDLQLQVRQLQDMILALNDAHALVLKSRDAQIEQLQNTNTKLQTQLDLATDSDTNTLLDSNEALRDTVSSYLDTLEQIASYAIAAKGTIPPREAMKQILAIIQANPDGIFTRQRR